MNKLIVTLALAFALSGAAVAGDYFQDNNADLANVPVSANQAYDGVALDWAHGVTPVPSRSGDGFASNESENDRSAG